MKNLIQNILFFTLLSITNAVALIEIDITEGNRIPKGNKTPAQQSVDANDIT